MKYSHFIKHLMVVLTLLVFMVGCASTAQKASTGEYIDDTVLTTKVKTEIFNDPQLNVFEINVETFKGVVQLSGFVDSQATITRAVEMAKSVNGVQSVKNSLIVK